MDRLRRYMPDILEQTRHLQKMCLGVEMTHDIEHKCDIYTNLEHLSSQV